jgi:hypothetical protein
LTFNKNRKLLKYIFFNTLTILSIFFYVDLSLKSGKLSADIGFDDIVYILDSAKRISILDNQGFFSFLKSFFETPPHSPFSTGLGVIALFFGGFSDLVFYFANGIIILGVSAFFLNEFRNVNISTLILIFFVFLSSTLTYVTIENFRPDLALGVMNSIMVWCFLKSVINNNKEYLLYSGLSLGLSLLIKPSFFMHTLAISFVLIFISWVYKKRVDNSYSISDVLKKHFFLGLIIASPLYLLRGFDIFHYFYNNAMGINKIFWTYSNSYSNLDLAKIFLQLNQYSFGIGSYFYLLVIIFSLIFFAANNEKKHLIFLSGFLLIIFVSFSILIYGAHQNQFFFSFIQYSLLFAAVYCFSEILTNKNVYIVLFVSIPYFFYNFITFTPKAFVNSNLIQKSNSELRSSISKELNQCKKLGSNEFSSFTVLMAYNDMDISGPIFPYVEWNFLKSGFKIQTIPMSWDDNLDHFINNSKIANFIIIDNENNPPNTDKLIPITNIKNPINRHLSSNSFQLLNASSSGTVSIYKNIYLDLCKAIDK